MSEIDSNSNYPLPNEWLRRYFTSKYIRPGSTELIAVAKNIQMNLALINPRLAGPAIEALVRQRNGALSRKERGLSVVEKFLAHTVGSVSGKLDLNMDSPEAVIISGMSIARELDNTGQSPVLTDEERVRANLVASRVRASTLIWGKEALGPDSEQKIWILQGFTKPATVWPTDRRDDAISAYLNESYDRALFLITVPPTKLGHLPIGNVYDRRFKNQQKS